MARIAEETLAALVAACLTDELERPGSAYAAAGPPFSPGVYNAVIEVVTRTLLQLGQVPECVFRFATEDTERTEVLAQRSVRSSVIPHP